MCKDMQHMSQRLLSPTLCIRRGDGTRTCDELGVAAGLTLALPCKERGVESSGGSPRLLSNWVALI
jgi:hypothetical protein